MAPPEPLSSPTPDGLRPGSRKQAWTPTSTRASSGPSPSTVSSTPPPPLPSTAGVGKLGRDTVSLPAGPVVARRSGDMPAVRPPNSARSSRPAPDGTVVRGSARALSVGRSAPQASSDDLAPLKRPPSSSRGTGKSMIAMCSHVVGQRKVLPPAKYYDGTGPKRELSRRARKPPAEAWGETPAGADGANASGTALPTPTTTPGSRGGSAPARLARRAPSERPYPGEKTERCGRCVREAVWQACDVFWTFDQTFSGEILRSQYSTSLAEAPTVDRLRMLRKSQLDMRFRRSAKPVTLKEFLCMIWPGAVKEEISMMRQWSRLREAHAVVMAPNFRASDADVRRVFDLLLEEPPEVDSEGECPVIPPPREVPLGELVRAQLIPRKEALKMMQGQGNDKAHQQKEGDLYQMLSLEVFRIAVQPVLKQMYVTQDVLKRMKQEEDMSITNNLESMFIKTK